MLEFMTMKSNATSGFDHNCKWAITLIARTYGPGGGFETLRTEPWSDGLHTAWRNLQARIEEEEMRSKLAERMGGKGTKYACFDFFALYRIALPAGHLAQELQYQQMQESQKRLHRNRIACLMKEVSKAANVLKVLQHVGFGMHRSSGVERFDIPLHSCCVLISASRGNGP